MNRCLAVAVWCMIFVAVLTGCKTQEAKQGGDSADKQEIHIIDISNVSSNDVSSGPQSQVKDAQLMIAENRAHLDAAVIYGTNATSAIDKNASTIAQLLRAGVPVFIVEKDGKTQWRDQSHSANIHTVTVKTEQLSFFRSLRKKRSPRKEASTVPSVSASVQVDTDTGAYDMTRVEVGLFGKKVWLVQEQDYAGDTPATVGLKFKKEF